MTLHDHTRRVIALILFFLLGPMLCVSVLGVIVWRKSPWVIAAHERNLLRESGFNLKIGGIEFERPGRTRYKKIVLHDPETGEPVLECPELILTFVKTENLSRFQPETAKNGQDAENGGSPPPHLLEKASTDEKQSGLVDYLVDSIPFRKSRSGYWKVLSPSMQIRFDRVSPDVSGTVIKDFFFGLLAKRRGIDEAPLEFVFDTIEIHLPKMHAMEQPGKMNASGDSANVGHSEYNVVRGQSGEPAAAPTVAPTDTAHPPYAHRYDPGTAAENPDLLSGHISEQYTAGRQSIELKNVQGRYYSSNQSTRLDARCSLPYFGPEQSIAFHAVRSRSGAVPSTHLSFSVPTDTSIPVPLLTVFMPQLAPLGKDSRFCGTIRADQTRSETLSVPLASDRNWNIVWENVTLRSIDLTHPLLAPHYTPYRVTGTVHGIRIDSARFHGTLLEATGWVYVVRGTIEKQLLQRLVSRFRLNVLPEHYVDAFPTDAIPFAECGIYFRLTPTGAQILPAFKASADAERTLVLYSDSGMQLHARPNAFVLSYAELLAALVRDDTPAIPFTPGASKIMGMMQE